MAVSVSQSSYGTVQNAYDAFGGGPISYNAPYSKLRQSSPSVNINTNGGDRQDRINQQVERAVERADTQRAVQRGLARNWQDDFQNFLTSAPLMPSASARNALDRQSMGYSLSSSLNSPLSAARPLDPLMAQQQANQQWKNTTSAARAGYDANSLQAAYNNFLQKSASFGNPAGNPNNLAYSRYGI